MDPVAVVAVALYLLPLLVLAAAYVRDRDRLRRGETVIVCTRRPDDQSVHGVVVQDTRRGIVLDAAHLLVADRDPVPVGRVVVERPVAFVQRGVAHVGAFREEPRERPAPIPLPDTSRPARLRGA